MVQRSPLAIALVVAIVAFHALENLQVRNLRLTDISDGDLRGDPTLEHLYAAQDGRQLTPAEQAAAGVGDEERIYWCDTADTSVLPAPDALHQGAIGWLESTLAQHGIDPAMLRADYVHYVYRRD